MGRGKGTWLSNRHRETVGTRDEPEQTKQQNRIYESPTVSAISYSLKLWKFDLTSIMT